MTNAWKITGVALALTLVACGGESSANETGAVSAEDADTSQQWVSVVSETEEGGYRMGNPNAPIQIVEFASLTCSHCATFAEESFDPLTENYISQGLVSFEVRNFVRDPLDLTAAVLSRCNGAGPFFQMNEALFANQANMFQTIQGADQAALQAISTPQAVQSGEAFVGFARLSGLLDVVGGLGISEERARECLTNTESVQQLEAMRNAALEEHNISGTPSFVINGELVQGVSSWPALQARLEEMVQ